MKISKKKAEEKRLLRELALTILYNNHIQKISVHDLAHRMCPDWRELQKMLNKEVQKGVLRAEVDFDLKTYQYIPLAFPESAIKKAAVDYLAKRVKPVIFRSICTAIGIKVQTENSKTLASVLQQLKEAGVLEVGEGNKGENYLLKAQA